MEGAPTSHPRQIDPAGHLSPVAAPTAETGLSLARGQPYLDPRGERSADVTPHAARTHTGSIVETPLITAGTSGQLALVSTGLSDIQEVFPLANIQRPENFRAQARRMQTKADAFSRVEKSLELHQKADALLGEFKPGMVFSQELIETALNEVETLVPHLNTTKRDAILTGLVDKTREAFVTGQTTSAWLLVVYNEALAGLDRGPRVRVLEELIADSDLVEEPDSFLITAAMACHDFRLDEGDLQRLLPVIENKALGAASENRLVHDELTKVYIAVHRDLSVRAVVEKLIERSISTEFPYEMLNAAAYGCQPSTEGKMPFTSHTTARLLAAIVGKASSTDNVSPEQWLELVQTVCAMNPKDEHGPPVLKGLLANVDRASSPFKALQEIFYESDMLSSQQDRQQMYALLSSALEQLPDNDQKKDIHEEIADRLAGSRPPSPLASAE